MGNNFHSRKKSFSTSSKQQGKAGLILLIIVVLIVFLASLAISSSWNTDEYSPIVTQTESENNILQLLRAKKWKYLFLLVIHQTKEKIF